MSICYHCGRVTDENDLQELPKDEELLEKFIEHHKLEPVVQKNDESVYVCKGHLEEEMKSRSPEPIDEFSDEVDPEAVFQMDVKQEVEEEPSGFFTEAKEEPPVEEISYDSFPYEMESTSNSYSTFEETGSTHEQPDSYEECQPTTSSAHVVKDESYNDMPVYLPELTDGQIMSVCVKTSGTTSGKSSFECGLCPEKFFSSDTRPIRLHLHLKHCVSMNALKNNKHTHLLPKVFGPLSASTRAEADKALCRFILRNGMPLKSVLDRNLEMLAFNMNSEYTLPSVDTLFQYVEEFSEQAALHITPIDTHYGPVAVTFDTTMFNNVKYLAFTVTFYKNRSETQRRIFLREIESGRQLVPHIMSTIRQTIGDTDSSLQISTVVTGNTEHEETLEDLGCFRQVMVCFSQNIDKFAKALTTHPIFAKPLNILRNFIRKFPQQRQLWLQFKSFVVKRRTYGEFPSIDEGHWCHTLDFITKCLHMHRLFSEFSSMHRLLQYIDVEDNVNMVYLHSLLNLCKSALKSMVETNATIADVIPNIIDISGSIAITTSRADIIDEVNKLFNTHLRPFVYQSDIHRFAYFLHPNHQKSSLLSEKELRAIRMSLARQLSLRATSDGDMTAMPAFRDTDFDKEVADYWGVVSRRAMDGLGAMEWWYRNARYFPRLYTYMKELNQIPAFVINASYYLGEYGQLTNGMNELEPAQRRLILQASSELVQFHSKGEVAVKQICVKRKRDPTCPEDSWYIPVDTRTFRDLDTRANLPRTNVLSPIVARGPAVRPAYFKNPPRDLQTVAQAIETMGTFQPPQTSSKSTEIPKRMVRQREPTLMERAVKREGDQFQFPTAVKKYYTVRNALANGQIAPVNAFPKIINTGSLPRVRYPVVRNSFRNVVARMNGGAVVKTETPATRRCISCDREPARHISQHPKMSTEKNVHELEAREQDISKVKVYTDRAEICRTVKVTLKPGVNEVVLNNLCSSLVHESLRVEGRGKATIHDVAVKSQAALKEETDSPKIAAIRTHLKEEQARLRSIADKRQVIQKSIDNLDKVFEQVGSGLVNPPKEGGGAALNDGTIESLSRFFEFYGTNAEAYRDKLREMEEVHREQQQKVLKAELELKLLENQRRSAFAQAAIITLDTKEETEAELDVIYQVRNAGWSPSYDIRVDTDKPSMNIAYFGKIRQHTNEDWSNAPLVLSTAQPCLGGRIPELGTLDAVFYSQQPPPQVFHTRGLFGGMAPQAREMPQGGQLFGAVAATGFVNAAPVPAPMEVAVASEVNQNTLSTEFKIVREASIPHGTNDHKVTIGIVTLSSKLVHETVPSKNAAAFLTASAINTSELAFLAGDSSVYLNNAFVAKSHLKNVSPGEKFTCSLGVDTAIRVEYKAAKKYHEEGGYITKHSADVTEQTISVKNTRSEQPVLLTIKHHVPRSTDEKIRVKLIHPAAAPYDPEKAANEPENAEPAEGAKLNSSNNLEWTVKLAPGNSQDLVLKYVVEHPKEERVQFQEKF
ncbi:unnamed protein product [Caenorhabditis sp. 36 PRJEB53466]|nr:unnamed protein product [Caenorhabditis sp. 36 PRJEB53466]